MNKDRVWVVIPAYNEGKSIQEVIISTKKYVRNIVVVDDGSKDRTYPLAKQKNVHVLRHVINLGKGATLKTGCDFAIKKGAEAIVVLDADAQHNPKEIPKFLKKLQSYDLVVGCRKLNRSMPGVLRFGNWFISTSIKFFYGISIQDTQSGYRAFTKEAYQKIRWKARDYSMESEMIANAGKHKISYTTTSIETLYPNKYKGTTVLDGIKVVINLIRWRLVRKGW